MYTLSIEGVQLSPKRSCEKDKTTGIGQLTKSSSLELHQFTKTFHLGVLHLVDTIQKSFSALAMEVKLMLACSVEWPDLQIPYVWVGVICLRVICLREEVPFQKNGQWGT